MPTWWSEFITLFHQFGFQAVSFFFLIGIILKWLIIPWFTHWKKGLTKASVQLGELHRAKRHPHKRGDDDKPLIIPTHDLLEVMEATKEMLTDHFAGIDCPMVTAYKKDMEPIKKAIEELSKDMNAQWAEHNKALHHYQVELTKERKEAKREIEQYVKDVEKARDEQLEEAKGYYIKVDGIVTVALTKILELSTRFIEAMERLGNGRREKG